MPQKKNPDLLELVRDKSGRILGYATALMVSVKGLPLAYNKDLQETQEPLFGATDALLQMLPLVTGWMRAVEFHHERMEQAADSGFMNAWAAATYLVKRGVPSRLAHERIGKAVQICLEKNCRLNDLSFHDLQALSAAFGNDFYESLKLSSVLAIHDVPGGTAPTRVRLAIADARKKVDALLHEGKHELGKEVHAHT